MELVNDFTVNAGIEETWKTLTDLELIAPCMPGAQLTEVEGETYRGLVKVKVGPITAQFKGQAHFVERDADRHKAVLKADGRDTGGKGNASALITAQLETVTPTSTKCTVTTDLTITGKVAQFGRGALADVSDKLLKQFVHNLETTVLHEDADHQAAASAVATTATATPAGAAATGAAGADAGSAPAGEAPWPSPAPTAAVATTPSDEAPADAPATDAPATDAPATKAAEAPAAASSAPKPTETAAPTTGPSVRKIESKPAEPIDLLETAGAPLLKRLAPVGALILLLVFLLRRRGRS